MTKHKRFALIGYLDAYVCGKDMKNSKNRHTCMWTCQVFIYKTRGEFEAVPKTGELDNDTDLALPTIYAQSINIRDLYYSYPSETAHIPNGRSEQ